MNLQRFVIVSMLAILLTGCGGMAFPSPTLTATVTALPPIPTETPTVTTTPTQTIIITPSPSPTATPTWVAQGPNQVKVPILLYHHISVSPIGSRYYVPPDKFETEIKLLHDWGYSTIPTTMLVKTIVAGASLPPRPIIITFDDANEDNYTNAFPIMKKYGFTGVLYLPYDYIGTNGYLTVDQVKEMAAAGWEVGSHTLSHSINFPIMDPPTLRSEIVDSRKKLAALLGLPIMTFAYPFGDAPGAAVDYVHFAGYIAGMGATGYTADQGMGNLFVLQRCEIKGSDDAKSMTRFLPWLGDPSFLPTDTPTPTATPTWTPKPTWTP
jgi:peptidoglycan/xylan/chitin deacetylase (PgdA/CDA1 family)